MPVIRDAARRWLEQQVRSGLLPASAGGTLDELATAVHDRRYALGPLSAYLRDPQVENVDVNGCDQVWVTYATGEKVAGPPVATSDDALIATAEQLYVHVATLPQPAKVSSMDAAVRARLESLRGTRT